MTQNNNKINYLSMFSGIGGFELGIQNSRYGEKLNCIGFMEIDKYAKNIYRQHYPNHTDYGDATKIDPKDLPAIDFLVGGFPCQAFSVAGKRRGFDDTRGTLFFEIARVLKEKKPRYFLLENVKGLLSHDKGRTFQTMFGVLSDLGYDVQWEVFNSKNHGVPQNRERIYIKGFLREKCGQEILSLRKTNPKINAGQGEDTRSIVWCRDRTGQHKFVNTNYNSLTITAGGQNSGGNQLIIEDKKEVSSPELIKVGNLSENGNQSGRVYDSRGLSVSISANGGGMGGKTGLYKIDEYGDVYSSKICLRDNTKKGYMEAEDGDGFVFGQYNCRGRVQKQSVPTLNTGDSSGAGVVDNLRVRRLTPVECERLQGFPKIEKEVEVWWSDQVKKDVLNVMEKWLKNQKSVGNVEKTKLLESVRYVEKSSHPKNQKNKKPVPKNVHINLEEKKVQLLNHEKSSSNVKIVDKKNLYLPHIKQEDFVQQVVFMNSILDQIILHGKEELLQNELYSIHQKNGKIIVNLFGGEITPPVSCVETVTTILEKLMKSITSSHLDSEITVMTIQTWFYYVILVISGYIQKEMNINSLDYFKLSDKTGWTEYGYDGSPISNTQRYKCCGNAVTTNVVTFIMNTWDMKWT